jgi:hypothetical protein
MRPLLRFLGYKRLEISRDWVITVVECSLDHSPISPDLITINSIEHRPQEALRVTLAGPFLCARRLPGPDLLSSTFTFTPFTKLLIG